MMLLTRTIAVALIASIMGLQPVGAQSLHQDGAPAEIPPKTFSGAQYIDSRGCVFVRAGINGGTNWVPRVTRDRKLVCGFQPTLTAEQIKVAEQPPQVVKILPQAASETSGSKSPEPVQLAAAQMPVSEGYSASRSPKSPAQVPLRQPRHVAVKPYEPMADAAPALDTSTRATALPERVANRKPRRGDVVVEGQVAGNVRVLPKHVYEQRSNTTFTPPKGYKTVWKDDRLNPLRAEQTFDGKAKMDAIWTQTVPRRLIKLSAKEN